MYRSRDVDSQYENLWNSYQNSPVDKFSAQTYLVLSNKKKIDSHIGDMTSHILDRILLTNFVN